MVVSSAVSDSLSWKRQVRKTSNADCSIIKANQKAQASNPKSPSETNMSKEKTRDALLDTLVEIIAQTADPDQIILFGSRAQGTAGTESDYDFLVVVPGVKNERHVSRRIYRALLDQHVGAAVDVIVVDAAKLAQHRDTPGLIYQHALMEGRVCYDRAWLVDKMRSLAPPGAGSRASRDRHADMPYFFGAQYDSE